MEIELKTAIGTLTGQGAINQADMDRMQQMNDRQIRMTATATGDQESGLSSLISDYCHVRVYQDPGQSCSVQAPVPTWQTRAGLHCHTEVRLVTT
jgi:hypothetical protein